MKPAARGRLRTVADSCGWLFFGNHPQRNPADGQPLPFFFFFFIWLNINKYLCVRICARTLTSIFTLARALPPTVVGVFFEKTIRTIRTLTQQLNQQHDSCADGYQLTLRNPSVTIRMESQNGTN